MAKFKPSETDGRPNEASQGKTVSAEEIKQAIDGRGDEELVRRVRTFFMRYGSKFRGNPTFQQARKLFFEKYPPTKKGRKDTVTETLRQLSVLLNLDRK